MIPDAAMLSADVEELTDLIRSSRNVVGFTGAGISTECGVPDFRSPDSPWTRNKPIPFQAFLASEEARAEGWRRKFAMDDLYSDAKPGRGHRVLAEMTRSGLMRAIITQNIDNLHQASGVEPDRIIELHGNGSYAKCIECGRRHEIAAIRRRFEADGAPPLCEACEGYVKSATISFGQAMPKEEMRRAQAATLAADLFLAIGSSLVVYPAAFLPEMAVENGAKLVILNGQPTGLDAVADLVIRADIGAVLQAVGQGLA
ncbi:MAG: Sir2 family NAD-dependent protein deacetylase [Beijerinckiaceae bacterium]|nr:Sir2 family NAD-dependent protein deacetylase [Beijerinckiaceae bacterium]